MDFGNRLSQYEGRKARHSASRDGQFEPSFRGGTCGTEGFNMEFGTLTPCAALTHKNQIKRFGSSGTHYGVSRDIALKTSLFNPEHSTIPPKLSLFYYSRFGHNRIINVDDFKNQNLQPSKQTLIPITMSHYCALLLWHHLLYSSVPPLHRTSRVDFLTFSSHHTVKLNARLNLWRKNTQNGVFTSTDRMPDSLSRVTQCALGRIGDNIFQPIRSCHVSAYFLSANHVLPRQRFSITSVLSTN
ncbi:hypothetical protein Scep_001979 [Stephania cephalantha]|uniref:Uncharacterized protein n=1 Tax=Stephania cephalantha TaxID=152367 RepID=A0AAP0LAE9_9MAGN